jgi:class 3 adenylate cyclase
VVAIPETRYARKGDVHIAYQVVGDGPLDLPVRPAGKSSEGCLHTMLFAATHPDRVASLVLWSPYARLMRGADHPFGIPEETMDRVIDAQREVSGSGVLVDFLAPSRGGDPAFRRWWARCERLGAGPGTASAIYALYVRSDLRGVLASIQAPTLVLWRTGDRYVREGHSAHVAAQIADSEFVELPGDDHVWFAGDADAVVDRIESFLTGRRSRVNPNRVLSTVLFTDIAGSTERAAALGDDRWAALLAAHHDLTGRLVRDFGGRVVKSTGDGMLATFDGPARAISCAREIHGALESLDLVVRIGLHTGEIEMMADDVGGIAVHIAARIVELAQPGQVLVSGAVPPLVLGSGIAFEERGIHELRGIPDRWPIFAVAESSTG